MKTIAIIGYGRFGQLLADVSQGYFSVRIIETDTTLRQKAVDDGYDAITIRDLSSVDYIFLVVPISGLKAVMQEIAPHLTARHVVIDVASVKTYPVGLMKKYIHTAQLLASHPMFGPDSASKGLKGLQVAYCPIAIDADNLDILLGLWRRRGVITIETTPEDHDKDTAYSQAFTYSVAKLILATEIPDVTFTTRSFKAITEVAKLSARDTDQLFHDMLFYNPYFPEMKHKLEKATEHMGDVLEEIAEEQRRADIF